MEEDIEMLSGFTFGIFLSKAVTGRHITFDEVCDGLTKVINGELSLQDSPIEIMNNLRKEFGDIVDDPVFKKLSLNHDRKSIDESNKKKAAKILNKMGYKLGE